MSRLVLCILFFILTSASANTFPHFVPLTEAELKECKQMNLSALYRDLPDTTLAVRYRLEKGVSLQDTINALMLQVKYNIDHLSPSNEDQTQRQNLQAFVTKPFPHHGVLKKDAENPVSYVFWLLLSFYEYKGEPADSTLLSESKKIVQWISHIQMRDFPYPDYNPNDPRDVKTLLGGLVLCRFMYDTHFEIANIEKKFITNARSVSQKNNDLKLLELLYSSIPNNAITLKKRPTITPPKLIKEMGQKNRARYISLSTEESVVLLPFLGARAYAHYQNGNDTLALIDFRNFFKDLNTKDLILLVYEEYRNAYATLLKRFNKTKELDTFITIATGKKKATPSTAVKKKPRRRAGSTMSFFGAGFSSMHHANLSYKMAIEKPWLLHKKPIVFNIKGGLYGGSAGVGIGTGNDWSRVGLFASLNASYLRTWNARSSEKRFDIEDGLDGLLLSADLWFVFATLDIGVAIFPGEEKPAHFYIGGGGSFPLPF